MKRAIIASLLCITGAALGMDSGKNPRVKVTMSLEDGAKTVGQFAEGSKARLVLFDGHGDTRFKLNGTPTEAGRFEVCVKPKGNGVSGTKECHILNLSETAVATFGTLTVTAKRKS